MIYRKWKKYSVVVEWILNGFDECYDIQGRRLQLYTIVIETMSWYMFRTPLMELLEYL